ncbi:MAG: hypothetical protein MZW92_23670 [Comamonadaceae bacterium]|nr:hypothetical protein [Comamonadaceae bacterium]
MARLPSATSRPTSAAPSAKNPGRLRGRRGLMTDADNTRAAAAGLVRRGPAARPRRRAVVNRR